MPDEPEQQSPQLAKAEALANAAAAYLLTVTNGFVVSNQSQVSPAELWRALATGMARVLSLQTKDPASIEQTLRTRVEFRELLSKGLHYIPAMDRATSVPPPANDLVRRQ